MERGYWKNYPFSINQDKIDFLSQELQVVWNLDKWEPWKPIQNKARQFLGVKFRVMNKEKKPREREL